MSLHVYTNTPTRNNKLVRFSVFCLLDELYELIFITQTFIDAAW